MPRFNTAREALDSDRLVTLAHRGAASYAPENTLPSFELAIQQGVDFIELDVKFSADGALVIIHDATVDRTSSGTGAVRELTFEQLRALDFGGGFGDRYRGAQIPTLQQVLRLAKGRCLVDIELKIDRPSLPADDERLVDAVVREVEAFGMRDQVLLSGFSREALSFVKRKYPHLVCGLAIAEQDIRRSVSFAAEQKMELVFPQVYSGTPEYLSFVHSLGLKVWICVFDATTAVVHDLAAAGVDGLMANNPDTLGDLIALLRRR